MRVLHFFKTYWPDSFTGIERVIDAIACATEPLGVGTTVLSLSRNPSENSRLFHGHRAEKARLDFEAASTGFSLQAFSRFRDLVIEADLIHYHFPWPFMDVVHFATRPKKPMVVTYHSDIVKQRLLRLAYAPLMHGFLSAADRIVATSPNYAASSPVLARHAARTVTIPIGIADQAADVPADRRAYWRARFQRPFLLFAGVLRYYKGLTFLVEAARSVDADIVLVGEGPLGPMLKAQAEAAGLQRLHFVGRLDDGDRNALMSLCAGFVFPSHLRSEAFGVALLEAAMFARPLISCEIGTGTTFINRHGETGIAVPPADPAALAEAMNTLLADPIRAARWGAAARRRYLEHMTAEQMGRAYYALYREVLGAW